MDTLTIDRDAHYYHFNEEMTVQLFEVICQKHYPHRIPPKKWPDLKLIGKAMVRGWAIPCRYYSKMWGRGGFYKTFIFPGITDEEMKAISLIMRGIE